MKGTPVTEEIVDYMIRLFPAEDELLVSLKKEAEEAGIPPIQISPEQAAFMQVLLKSTGAKHIIEIGTLAGYSAIIMARALPEGGTLTTIECDPLHAEFARNYIAKAGLSDKVKVLVGPGIDILERELKKSGPYDFAFIDADKVNYVRYAQHLLPLMRPGGLIAGDNALAWGEIADETTDREDVQGMQAFNQYMASEPRLQCALLPIGDGMCLGVVQD